MYANVRNGLRRKGIVPATTLGAENAASCKGIRGRNETAAYRFLSGSRNQENAMNKFGRLCKPPMWFAALLLAALAAGCGGGGGGAGSVTGSGTAVVPGAAGTPGAAVTDPTVSSANPSDGAINVPTSTSGSGAAPIVTGTLVTATFSEVMNPLTVTPTGTFTLKEKVSGTNVPGTVTMNAGSTIATFTPTAAALTPNTGYTATVTTAAKSALGTAMPSTVAWSFTTAITASTGQSSPDIGTASTYGVFASAAAVTLAVNSLVNGDVGLNPADTCGNCVVGVTILGGVIHNGDAQAIQAQTDFGAAYVDASTRATSACPIVNAELASAQASCNGVTPGPSYGPGLYRTADPLLLGTGMTMTLDAGGNPDAVFIFQSDVNITTGTNSTVVLTGGAQAKNVWWIAGSAATLGVSSIFKGTVIANGAAITVLNGTGGPGGEPTLVEGRLFSSSAAVGVAQFATVTVPQ